MSTNAFVMSRKRVCPFYFIFSSQIQLIMTEQECLFYSDSWKINRALLFLLLLLLYLSFIHYRLTLTQCPHGNQMFRGIRNDEKKKSFVVTMKIEKKKTTHTALAICLRLLSTLAIVMIFSVFGSRINFTAAHLFGTAESQNQCHTNHIYTQNTHSLDSVTYIQHYETRTRENEKKIIEYQLHGFSFEFIAPIPSHINQIMLCDVCRMCVCVKFARKIFVLRSWLMAGDVNLRLWASILCKHTTKSSFYAWFFFFLCCCCLLQLFTPCIREYFCCCLRCL